MGLALNTVISSTSKVILFMGYPSKTASHQTVVLQEDISSQMQLQGFGLHFYMGGKLSKWH